jgi:hypothetical protein
MIQRRDSEAVASGSPRECNQNNPQVVSLIPCRSELCEQVFDDILDTIVTKVQRQIDESRRIAMNHDDEPSLQIEVRCALIV